MICVTKIKFFYIIDKIMDKLNNLEMTCHKLQPRVHNSSTNRMGDWAVESTGLENRFVILENPYISITYPRKTDVCVKICVNFFVWYKYLSTILMKKGWFFIFCFWKTLCNFFSCSSPFLINWFFEIIKTWNPIIC